MGKDGNDMLSSCGSIGIVLEVTSNLNTTKGRASAKEPCIARGQRQALEICSLVKGWHDAINKSEGKKNKLVSCSRLCAMNQAECLILVCVCVYEGEKREEVGGFGVVVVVVVDGRKK
jgi:hypothetical protein